MDNEHLLKWLKSAHINLTLNLQHPNSLQSQNFHQLINPYGSFIVSIAFLFQGNFDAIFIYKKDEIKLIK